jgi:hypothetical protein
MYKYIILAVLFTLGIASMPEKPTETLTNGFHAKYVSCMASTRSEEICAIYRK